MDPHHEGDFPDQHRRQDAAGQGKGAVDTAIKLVKGEKVDPKVYIPFQLVTPDNMANFAKKN